MTARRPTRIGVAADILLQRRMGMERYADAYLEHVPREGVELVGVFTNEAVSKPYFDETVVLPDRDVNGVSRRLPGVIRSKRIVDSLDLDLIHCPTQDTPPYFWFVDARRAITIHGAAEFELGPDEHRQPSRKKVWAYRLLKHRLDLVITPSRSSKAEVVANYAIPEHRVTPIHHGIAERFHPVDETVAAETVRGYDLPAEYLLAVGRTQPKKNVPNLLRGYDRFRREGFDLPLVLVGGQSWGHDAVRRVIEERSLDAHVHFAPYIETADLPALYTRAELTCYPSLHEGFGFPILESMACGTPVVTSNRYSMPEVGGDAVLLVDPYDPDDIGEKLIACHTDGELRARLVEAGLERARRFTWEKSGRAHLRAFECALT